MPSTQKRAWTRSTRRRVARALLVVGALFVAFHLLRAAPTDQVLEVRVTEAGRPGRLTVTWTRENESEPAGGVSLNFPEGVPKRVEHQVSLPNGRYAITLELETAPDKASAYPVQTNVTHQVTLSGGSTLLRL